jgi:alkylated DNA repair protein (DNA oxidative demethylase)
MLDLFAEAEPWQEPLAPGAVILRRFACGRCLTV